MHLKLKALILAFAVLFCVGSAQAGLKPEKHTCPSVKDVWNAQDQLKVGGKWLIVEHSRLEFSGQNRPAPVKALKEVKGEEDSKGTFKFTCVYTFQGIYGMGELTLDAKISRQDCIIAAPDKKTTNGTIVYKCSHPESCPVVCS